MRLIGITGSIACGKSTVSSELLRRGYTVIDGDVLSRELTVPGSPVMNEIRSVFGARYILPDGSLNRRELGRLIFSDPKSRERLDQLMEPHIRAPFSVSWICLFCTKKDMTSSATLYGASGFRKNYSFSAL